MENTQNTKTRYSFLQLWRAVTGQNVPFAGAILTGRFTQADKTVETITTAKGERTVAHCRMAIHNRDKLIRDICGKCPPPNEQGAVWAQITFFGRTAERFVNFAAKYPNAEILVTGQMQVYEQLSKKDGKMYINISIAASDFTAPNIRSQDQAPAATTAPAAAAQPGYAGYQPTVAQPQSQPPVSAAQPPVAAAQETQPAATGWGQRPAATTAAPVAAPAPAPAPAAAPVVPQPQANDEGFVDILADDGDLPF